MDLIPLFCGNTEGGDCDDGRCLCGRTEGIDTVADKDEDQSQEVIPRLETLITLFHITIFFRSCWCVASDFQGLSYISESDRGKP